MKKAVKFGGSSLADATQFRKCAASIQADPSRRYVVPSAPGKRFRDDVKITDMLIECYEIQRKDLDQGLECFSRVEDRFDEIIRDLGLDYSLEPEYRLIRSYMEEGLSRDYLVSRGEFLSGKVLAALLGFPFVDPADYIVFNSNGVFEEQKTAAAFRKIVDMDRKIVDGEEKIKKNTKGKRREICAEALLVRWEKGKSAEFLGNIGLKEGNVIEHQRFGIGTVIKVEGSGENTKATVAFKNAGTKQLLLKFAKYTIVK